MHEETLPFTLLVDGEPGDDKLAVVISAGALEDEALRDAIQNTRPTREVWAVGFVLPQDMGIDR